MRKTNKKLYVLSVVPIVAILYFLTATGIQDDSMWDISTNEYYQQGANFELFALTYEECQKWPTNVQQARNCPTSSSSGGSSSTSTEKDYGSIYTPTPTTSNNFWDNIFTTSSTTQSSSSTTSSSTPTSTSTVFSCQSNVAMFYKDDERNTWRGYGSTWTEIRGLELTPKSDSDKGKIIEIKGDVYMKCDWKGNGSMKLTSATTRTILTDGFGAGTYSYSGQGSMRGVGINAFTSDMYAEDYDFHLINGHKTKIGEINHITESQLESIENYLSPITYQGGGNCDGNSCVGITFTTTLSPKFVLSNDFGVTKVGITENHISSMLFTSTLQEPTIVIAGPTSTTPMKIESITNANTYEDLMYIHFEVPFKTLDTGIDVSKSDRQIKIISSMRDYDSREGSPIIKLTHGSEVIKITSNKVEKYGDSQRFMTYYTMPIDSTNGQWTVTIENVNRPDMSSSEIFVINNSTPAQFVCNPDKTYQLRDNPECHKLYPAPENNTDELELKELEKLKVGVMWKTVDSGGVELDAGSSFDNTVGFELLSITQLIDPRYDSNMNFHQVIIQPIIKFDSNDSSERLQLMNKYSLDEIYDPQAIKVKYSIPNDGTTKNIEDPIQYTKQYSLSDTTILGTAYMSQANADDLADSSTNIEVGDRFTIQAEVFGKFELKNKQSNNVYKFMFEDVTVTQEFRYGVEGDDPEKSEKERNEREKCEDGGKVYAMIYAGFECITVEENNKRECNAQEGKSWDNGIDNGICIVVTDSEESLENQQDECESKGGKWNVGQNRCEDPQPRNVDNGGDGDDGDGDNGVGSSSGNLQLCSPGQSISDCIKDLQVKQSSLIIDDNTIMIIGIIFAVLILVAIIARRRQPSMGGLMNRYG